MTYQLIMNILIFMLNLRNFFEENKPNELKNINERI